MWHKGKFDRHFADWKNKLTSFCNGDYIFQIDADEIPRGRCIFTEESLTQCPECDDVDGFADYILSKLHQPTVSGAVCKHQNTSINPTWQVGSSTKVCDDCGKEL